MIIRTLLISLLFCSSTVSAQEEIWMSKTFDDLVTLNLPTTTTFQKQGFVHSYTGSISGDEFMFMYMDTSMHLKDEHTFKLTLNGFMKGVTGRYPDSSFSIRGKEARIGGMPGLLFAITSNDRAYASWHQYHFATIANDRLCLFVVSTNDGSEQQLTADRFFGFIRFYVDRIKESRYKETGLLMN